MSWNYVCTECGKRRQSFEKSCRWCKTTETPDMAVCNNCKNAKSELMGDDQLFCNVKKENVWIGDICKNYDSLYKQI